MGEAEMATVKASLLSMAADLQEIKASTLRLDERVRDLERSEARSSTKMKSVCSDIHELKIHDDVFAKELRLQYKTDLEDFRVDMRNRYRLGVSLALGVIGLVSTIITAAVAFYT